MTFRKPFRRHCIRRNGSTDMAALRNAAITSHAYFFSR